MALLLLLFSRCDPNVWPGSGHVFVICVSDCPESVVRAVPRCRAQLVRYAGAGTGAQGCSIDDKRRWKSVPASDAFPERSGAGIWGFERVPRGAGSGAVVDDGSAVA